MTAATKAGVTTPTLIDGATPTSPSRGPTAATPQTGATVSPFENLHNLSVYEKTKMLCASEATQNFVVQFNHEEAEVAFNLEPAGLEKLLEKETPKGKVRWINIWTPTAQAPTMRVLGDHYGFSSRLQAIITMRPPEPKEAIESPRPASRSNKSGATGVVQPFESASEKGDIEHGSPTTETRIRREVPASLKKDLAIYRIVKDTMGFTSVDQGSRFICLGANWLHERGEEDNKQLLQPKHWSWLTLCNDHTVISIQETPVFEHPGDKVLRQKELENMRSNAVGILCQLSKIGIVEFKDNVIGLKSVRDTMKPVHGQIGLRRTASDVETTSWSDPQVEGSSNLFYYLFEDYGGAAAILEVSKKIVSDLDKRVLASARRRAKLKTMDIIPDLHTLRKELRQLQNLFQSYKNMIRRISHPRHATTYGEIPSGPIHLSGDVKISQSARSRFDRLEDRLQMLMLNTIQECLEEQNALSDTYFKITTQKDSQATARLTGSATLLAKMSVFFLPISFMTAFFSVEIPDFVASYTPRTYYVAFGVIAGLSFIALFFFSKLLMFFSDKLEEWAERLMRRLKWKKD